MVVALAAGSPAALAAEPTGEWLVEDKIAQIKIENCGGALWGVVSWEAKPGGRDNENPDPALRGRATLGMPILMDMKPTKSRAGARPKSAGRAPSTTRRTARPTTPTSAC